MDNKIWPGKFGKFSKKWVSEDYKDTVETFAYKIEDQFLKKFEAKIRKGPRTERLKKALCAKLTLSDEDKRLIRDKEPDILQVASIGTVTLGDYLYSLSQIQPEVINAIDFSRARTDFQTFEDVRYFIHENYYPINAGAMQSLKGFTGEQQVAKRLENLGYEIQFPDAANQEGFDLFVNGIPYQVKTIESASGIANHFQKYPDIPIIASVEMQEQFGDHPMVFIDPNLSAADSLTEATNTVETIMSFGESADIGIPVVTIMLSSYQAFRKCNTGKMNIGDALKFVALDTAAVGVGGFAGAKVGFAVGSILAPPTGGLSLVIGPALCAIIGAISGRVFVRWRRGREVRAAYNVLQESLYSLSYRILSEKEAIREFLAMTVRDQRMAFRRTMASALFSDGITLMVNEPSNNYLVLSEIAKRYKADSAVAWSNRTKITEGLLSHGNVANDDTLQKVVPTLFEYRGAIQMASPDVEEHYETAIHNWEEFNMVKEKYS